MLTFEDVTFAQGGFTLSADLAVATAKVTAVIGPSGAGKSTLLHGVAGFVRQTTGRLMARGEDISAIPPDQRPVSMLFQDNNLFPHLTVLQNVALAVAPRLRPTKADRERVEAMLVQVGLKGLSARKPAALSGGQQSRVALARALLQDRPLMLLDEPFGALGPGLKAEMLELSVSLAQGRTLMMVTHDPEDASQIADEVIGVIAGQALPPMPTQTFLSDPPHGMRDYFGTL